MTDADFLRAIVTDPHDDASRLVYADWLEEQGQHERAEFIRTQIQLAKLEASGAGEFRSPWLDFQYVRSRRREWELWLVIRHFFPDTRCPLADAVNIRNWWHRGFVDSIACKMSEWMQHGSKMVLAQPITQVKITDKEPLRISAEKKIAGWSSHKNPSNNHMPWELSQDIIDFLPTDAHCVLVHNAEISWPSRFSVRDYETEKHAINALSLACVNWAREKAGLPIMTSKE